MLDMARRDLKKEKLGMEQSIKCLRSLMPTAVTAMSSSSNSKQWTDFVCPISSLGAFSCARRKGDRSRTGTFAMAVKLHKI